MVKKIIFVLLLLVSIKLEAQIPSKFILKQDPFYWTTTFVIKETDCRISKEAFSFSKTFVLYKGGKKICYAKSQVFSFLGKINIYDENDNFLGSVEEQFGNIGFYSIYNIKDSKGNVIAKSKKIDFMETQFNIQDLKGNTICTMNRPYLRVFDNWEITYLSSIDKRLLIFIPCFKSNPK